MYSSVFRHVQIDLRPTYTLCVGINFPDEDEGGGRVKRISVRS